MGKRKTRKRGARWKLKQRKGTPLTGGEAADDFGRRSEIRQVMTIRKGKGRGLRVRVILTKKQKTRASGEKNGRS